MKIQNRGLSDVITTVLIILLAIAAVVLIWGFIRRPIEQGGQQIQSQTDCFQLKLKPTGCTINDTAATGYVQWEAGDVNLKNVTFMYKDTAGKIVTSGPDTEDFVKFGTVDSTDADVSALDLDNGITLSAVGIINVNGKLVSCTGATDQVPVSCTVD
jgi:hypothetical protein